jgi:adenylate kinase
MTERLLNRGKTSGRVDDNEETIKSRLQTFHNQTKPVIDYYEEQNKVRRVSSEKSPDLVFKDIELIFEQKSGSCLY